MHFDLSELYTDPICSKTLFHTAHVQVYGAGEETTVGILNTYKQEEDG